MSAKGDPHYPLRPEIANVDGPMREPVVKLGKLITDRIPIKLGLKKITKDDPEYWAVARLCTDEEAELALQFGAIRKPKTFAQLKMISGIEEKKLQEMLDHMSYTGLIEWNYENPQHEKQYVLPMFVPGSGEFSNMNKDLVEEYPELGMFFEHMTRLPLEKVTKIVPPGGAGIGMHVIPVEKAISMNNEAIGVEKISHWLDKYEGKYAKSPCSCRRSRKTYEEGCGDDEEGWCIAVGDMADYVVETNKGGVYITREEAMDIFKRAEDNGFVHQITNIDGENKIFAICNCNVNVCYALRTSLLFNTPNLSRSAYVAHVDSAKCVACGRCVESCPAGALKLGQKLCKKDGSEVNYPKHDLPWDRKWSEDDWDWEYRDHNRIEAHRSGTAPCKTACPAHIAVQGYLKMAAQGRYTDALALIKKNNPLPAICGHICNRRCEDACTRGTIDEAVAIDEVKKFIAMHDLHAETRYMPKKVIPRVDGDFSEDKVAIIGAGPAGLSCAYYLAEKGYQPTIFEKNEKPGGMIVYGIPSYKLEKDIIQAEIDIIKEMGVEIKTGVEVGKDITLDELRKQGYKAFYIAIGAQGGRSIQVAGEDGLGVVTAVDFLREINATESYDLKGDVVVVGGGNVAIDCSRDGRRVGANVTQVSLETRDIMPASEEEVEEALADGVKMCFGWGPKEILKNEKNEVTGIVFKKCVSVKDETGRFNPQYDEKETMTISCAHIVLAVGQSIVWGDLLEGENVELDRRGCVIADHETYQTSQPDIFVGGDVYTGPKFAIDAIAAGKEGAISIHRFVQPHTSLTIGRNKNDYVELNKNDILVESYDNAKRQIPAKKANAKPLSFRDYQEVFSEEQVKKEAARCLSCGKTIVDENHCVGCGICTTKCEFDAIHLERDHPECSTMRKSEDKMRYILPYAAKQAIHIKFGKKK